MSDRELTNAELAEWADAMVTLSPDHALKYKRIAEILRAEERSRLDELIATANTPRDVATPPPGFDVVAAAILNVKPPIPNSLRQLKGRSN